jgi:hypothetical protein
MRGSIGSERQVRFLTLHGGRWGPMPFRHHQRTMQDHYTNRNGRVRLMTAVSKDLQYLDISQRAKRAIDEATLDPYVL